MVLHPVILSAYGAAFPLCLFVVLVRVAGSVWLKMGDCRPPGSASVTGKMVAADPCNGLKLRMHDAPQRSGSFAMENADCQDPFFAACTQIFRDQVMDIARGENMQIKHSVDWIFNSAFVF
jgi:hypothetical protein